MKEKTSKEPTDEKEKKTGKDDKEEKRTKTKEDRRSIEAKVRVRNLSRVLISLFSAVYCSYNYSSRFDPMQQHS